MSFGDMPPGTESMCFFRSWSRYSNTRYSLFSLWMTSCSLRARSAVSARWSAVVRWQTSTSRRTNGSPQLGARAGRGEGRRCCCPHVPHDVGVLQLFEQRDLADRCAGHALILALEPDLLQRDDVARLPVLGLVDHAVGPLADLLELLVRLHLPQHNTATPAHKPQQHRRQRQRFSSPAQTPRNPTKTPSHPPPTLSPAAPLHKHHPSPGMGSHTYKN
eukprot:COSAG02_NODE_1738_length_11131_cov_5.714104_1_plen_218_part_00